GGMEGLRVAAALLPNAMLLDIGLPDVSGVDVCRRLKAMPATRDIAVVMLSSRIGEADRILGLEAGASDYVTKPFSLRELLLRLGMALGRRHGSDDLLVAGSIEIDGARLIVRWRGGRLRRCGRGGIGCAWTEWYGRRSDRGLRSARSGRQRRGAGAHERAVEARAARGLRGTLLTGGAEREKLAICGRVVDERTA